MSNTLKRLNLLIWAMFSISIAQPLLGIIDFNNDGLSDLWTSLYPGVTPNDEDSDGDGQTNHQEMTAGTDPQDANSLLVINQITGKGDEEFIFIYWDGIGGKSYTIERYFDGVWNPIQTLVTPKTSGQILAAVERIKGAHLLRITARDIDSDGDTINGWEESLIGWDDSTPYGSGSSSAQDYEQLIRLFEAPSGVSLTNGINLPPRLPSKEEASHFLQQSTFGPTMEAINQVSTNGITAWIDEQMDDSPTQISLTSRNLFQTGQPFNSSLWRHAWWRIAILGTDQLRQRMAYALSQITVINTEEGNLIGNNITIQANYYDPLIINSFGRYRDILDHVAYSPAMGFYLSHLRNRKADPTINRFPDENFAREIMQLFSIGLWELNPDGTRKTDIEGNFIETYDNKTITEMAKIFTGMSLILSNGRAASSFYELNVFDDYHAAMRVFDEEHEPGEKKLFDNIIIPDGQTGEEDVQMALDALSQHSSTAPFISHLLIQRFTSSNPSPEYIRRVSSAWTHSDGNLGQVIRAILLDPESRFPTSSLITRGKVREPIIRATHILRAFSPDTPNTTFAVLSNQLKNDLGHFPMSSPTVFNFYSPTFSPQGEIRDSGLVSPELEIANLTTLLASHDRFRKICANGHHTRTVGYKEEELLADNLEELLDRLDLILTAGTMSESTRNAVIEGSAPFLDAPTRVRVASHLITVSPDFTVLK